MATPQRVKTAVPRPKLFPCIPRSEKNNHTERYYYLYNFSKAYRSWLLPYLKARIHAKGFRPVLAFLFTDLNCNLDCHYCYNRGKKIPGMTMEVAKDAVNWLQSLGCRVLAYMGGEPLVRKDFIIELTRYATERGFFVYLPTNGTLIDEPFVHAIGKAGIATINLAVDSVEGYEGIPKCFTRIKDQLEYLVAHEKQYGYITFLNINITDKNIRDVKELTEIAHNYGIATDYHINEPPLLTYDTYEHQTEGAWITGERVQAVDELVDWLIEKNCEGYTMANSVDHIRAMKQFIRHQLPPWPCCAGELTLIIRLDGSLSPCMELYGSEEDWGSIYGGPSFNPFILRRLKQQCSPRCLSTCNFQVSHYTKSLLHSLQWVTKHAYAHFFGIS